MSPSTSSAVVTITVKTGRLIAISEIFTTAASLRSPGNWGGRGRRGEGRAVAGLPLGLRREHDLVVGREAAAHQHGAVLGHREDDVLERELVAGERQDLV